MPGDGVSRLSWIEQGDNRIFYKRLGDGDDGRDTEALRSKSGSPSPVILHHGLAQSGSDWWDAGWGEAFGDRDVYAIDALGHGQSGQPVDRVPYSIENRADAVLKVADLNNIEKFVFFGFSMGGRVGFELAVSHPSRVDRLIVGGMHGLKPSIDRRNLERRIAVLRSNKWRLVERAVGAHRSEDRMNTPEALALSTEAVLDWRGADDRLPDLNVPTLIYCGEQDSLLEYARQTADLIPDCEFAELLSTGHAGSFYSSDPAKQLVKRFLGDG